MKEDVLEQIVEDYLQLGGYLTTHNVRYRPSTEHADYVVAQDSVHSDVDIVGVHPRKRGAQRVVAVSCKSYQNGFNAESKLKQMQGKLKNPKKATWKHFRELWSPKWAAAFQAEVERRTKATNFTYLIAVTRLTGAWSAEEAAEQWRSDPTISANLGGAKLGFLELGSMWSEIKETATTMPANSEIGRLAQLLKAAGV